jgi:3-hydroxyisobutyrate dehydrogenase
MSASAPAIGFVGLGSMGGSIVQALIRAGHKPIVFDIDASKVTQAVERGAIAANELADVADGADIVGLCVANDAQIRTVMEGLLPGLAEGTVVSLHSTLLPETVLWAAEAAEAKGVGIVEAPVTGGAVAAAEGRLTFLLSGDDADLATLEPLLAACAGLRVAAGPLGKANLLKLCINLQTYVTHLAVDEAASLASALDVPLEGLKTAMEANGQLGELTRSYLVLHELPDDVLADPATVAMREPQMAIIAKDISLLHAVAAQVGRDLPAVRLASERIDDTYKMPKDPASTCQAR